MTVEVLELLYAKNLTELWNQMDARPMGTEDYAVSFARITTEHILALAVIATGASGE